MTIPWQVERQRYATVALPHEADIVVVGGGMLGVTIAWQLAEAGCRSLVVERERVAAGASGRNGGLLLPGTAELYLDLVARWGRADARALWALAERGARTLAGWLLERADEVQWRPEGGLHVAASEDEAARLQANVVALTDDGFDVSWLERPALGRFTDLPLPAGLPGALLLPGGGPLHSGRVVTALAAAAVRAGARLVEGCGVQAIAGGRDRVRLDTDQGTVSAGAAVLATNAWAGRLAPRLGPIITPVRGQVQVTAPLPPRRLRGAWYVHDGWEYFQQLDDGRVVLGGMRWTAPDQEVGHDTHDTVPTIHDRLTAWFEGLFPDLAPLAVTGRWAGIMGFTPDRLPLIGPADETGRLWLAAGFSGHGQPFAPLAAEIVTAGLTGRLPPPGAGFFDPGRPSLRP